MDGPFDLAPPDDIEAQTPFCFRVAKQAFGL